MRRRQRGFTLIEILIVIVILAVLAAMVLPRMLIQTENGYISEAQNIMGALRSAEITATDSGAQAAWSAQADTTIAIPALNWKAGNDSNTGQLWPPPRTPSQPRERTAGAALMTVR